MSPVGKAAGEHLCCEIVERRATLQTHGLGTAFKVLFSDIIPSCARTRDEVPFSLTRNDLVALLQVC